MMLIGPISLLNICDLKNLKTNLNLGLKLLPITDIGDVNMIFYFWKSFSLKKKNKLSDVNKTFIHISNG